MIHLSDLRVDYDETCAVRDLSLDIGASEVCGLIGPNGAGKTTTMKAILGLLEPTYGEIEVAGIDVREHPREAAQHVGFMPDNPPLYDDLLCWEFLDLFAASYGVGRHERGEVVEHYLDMVGLTSKRSAPITDLSRGMRQRLMLAKTLLPDPKILVLDEPASGVDPQGRIDLRNVLKDQARAGKCVLISSHILTEMTEFCTHMAIMERGRMVISGPIDKIRHDVMGGTTLVVELLGAEEIFQQLVASDPLAGAIHRNGEGKLPEFAFRYEGDLAQSSALLARLVSGGVPIASFARRKEGLEELFLKIGARELA
jgi:ABC-2 type transport system ATP-binding protein